MCPDKNPRFRIATKGDREGRMLKWYNAADSPECKWGEYQPHSPIHTMSDKIRIFVAIEIPANIKNGLGLLIKSLSESSGDARIRWVKTGSIHLTLKFIGDVAHGSVSKVTENIETVVSKRSKFKITVGGLGCFPNWNKPRVVWVGISEDSGKLTSLQKEIDLALEPLGIMSETRPFHAHLTVGRVKNPGDIGKRFSEMEIGAIGQVQVDEFCLIRSDLRSDGAVYTNLATFELQ
jgi:2'-5' RNA ligase